MRKLWPDPGTIYLLSSNIVYTIWNQFSSTWWPSHSILKVTDVFHRRASQAVGFQSVLLSLSGGGIVSWTFPSWLEELFLLKFGQEKTHHLTTSFRRVTAVNSALYVWVGIAGAVVSGRQRRTDNTYNQFNKQNRISNKILTIPEKLS